MRPTLASDAAAFGLHKGVRASTAARRFKAFKSAVAGMDEGGSVSVGEQAKIILGILTRHAGEDCGPLTYSDLTRETGIAHCALRAPMNRLITALERYAKDSRKQVPPLQALIVNSKTGVPGAGAWRHIGKPYVRDKGPEDLTIKQKRSVIELIHKEIAHYNDWQTVEQEVLKLL